VRRPFTIALKAVATYVLASLVVAIVMAELTLHPWRRPLTPVDKDRVEAVYARGETAADKDKGGGWCRTARLVQRGGA
jgi:hypothetical protein